MNNFSVSDAQLDLIKEYVSHLIDWNAKLNLISRKDEHNIWSRHILGSVGFLFKYRFAQNALVADVGTGGGLPGIPIAILCADLNLVLIDSIHKKVRAVSDILQKLQLRNARAVTGRAEQLAIQKDFTHTFDYVIARAVAPVKDILGWTKHFLNCHDQKTIAHTGIDEQPSIIPCASVVMLKGGDLVQEIEEVKVKSKPRAVTIHSIIVNGLESTADLSDKKLIIVQP
ncbi:MAG: 16S rRNA (guanine(527)-N(7))-methyltransferase RsmG [Ignavibacteriae bacterium]|nr:16S rRNA (guanine(527)-N(7))-methyltransferase RsmG [Ignavibacteria bacterium]MBI3365363.1 16S rRNA (guanine(527)-N(7))-methyltransferase RsmG [Ignavibacteriota bacterium]